MVLRLLCMYLVRSTRLALWSWRLRRSMCPIGDGARTSGADANGGGIITMNAGIVKTTMIELAFRA